MFLNANIHKYFAASRASMFAERAVVRGVALDVQLSLVTTISFHPRAAGKIHEPENLMWCRCAGQMKSPSVH